MKNKKLCGIYQITNLVNNKFYFGSTSDFNLRYGVNHDWTKHHNIHVKRAAKLYGNDKFSYAVMQICSSIEEAECMEQWWLDFFKMNKLEDCVYNTEYTVKSRGPDFNKKIRDGTKEALKDPDIKKRQSDGVKKAYENPEYKKKLSESSRAAHAKPDVKAKHKKATNEAINKPDVRARQKAGAKIAANSPDVKKRKSDSMKLSWATPEVRAKRTARNNDTDVKKNRSDAAKEAQNRQSVKEKPEVKQRRSDAAKHARENPILNQKYIGSNNASAKLNEKQVYEIRFYAKEYDNAGRSKRITKTKLKECIAAEYNVSASMIASVFAGDSWQHVLFPVEQKIFDKVIT